MNKIIVILIQVFCFLLSVSIHESAHAWTASKCGDNTALNMGRVTLNPIAHIDLIGTVILPLVLILIGAPAFGWAKPVPVDLRNTDNPRRSNLLVSAAGPLSNIFSGTIALVILLLMKKVNFLGFNNNTVKFILMLFLYFIVINIILAVFNLIPIHPLDGSGILESLLKGEALRNYMKIAPYGFIILLVLFYTDVLGYIYNPIINYVYRLIIQ